MIKFQQPYKLENSKTYIDKVIAAGRLEGDGKYTRLCESWISNKLMAEHVVMMNSCTAALECAMQVLDLKEGDEIIVPSFTFPSTANAVVLAGGTLVYANVLADTLTIDPVDVKKKISKKTKGIIVVHYAGVSCNMSAIMKIAKEEDLVVVEDCAQSFLSRERGGYRKDMVSKDLKRHNAYEDSERNSEAESEESNKVFEGDYTGTIGDFGCFSFHGTKDVIAGEGGALVINNDKYLERVHIFRQKGTNREAFISGKSDFYEWVDKGSSLSPSELNMAMLYGQLELAEEIVYRRRSIYKRYLELFNRMAGGNKGRSVDFSDIDDLEKTGMVYGKMDCYISGVRAEDVNGHIFFIVFKDVMKAKAFTRYLMDGGIETRTHFVPLHESFMGAQFIREEDNFEIEEQLGKRLVRLPIYPGLRPEDVDYICETVSRYLDR